MRHRSPRLIVLGLLAPLALAGCGDGDGEDESGTAPAETAPSGTPDGVGDLSPADEHAIEQAITGWLLAPRCDLATDDYLLRISLFADDDTTPDEACRQWTDAFVTPQYDADDIELTHLAGEGDRATIEVGSALIDITTVYELTFTDGAWKVSGDDFTDDDL